jgi:hypothetical protein
MSGTTAGNTADHAFALQSGKGVAAAAAQHRVYLTGGGLWAEAAAAGAAPSLFREGQAMVSAVAADLIALGHQSHGGERLPLAES